MDDSFLGEHDPIYACSHLMENADNDYFRHFTGVGVESYFLCTDCHQILVREKTNVPVQPLDRQGIQRISTEGFLDGISGEPSILALSDIDLPPVQSLSLSDPIITMAAMPNGCWLTYSSSQALAVFNPDTGNRETLMSISLPEETDEAWCEHHLASRLHCDPTGNYAVLVHDYGRYGVVINLHTRQVTMSLDGGEYYPETVPFSVCFIMHEGHPILIHRTDWNRLDASDPATGHLLTERGPTSYDNGEESPAHYLDYFHGGLHSSPSGKRVLNDGWVWHPAGLANYFDPHNWLRTNVWETEEACHCHSLMQRDDWDLGVAWLDDDRVILQTLIADASLETRRKKVGLAFLLNLITKEIIAFAGPAGRFFSGEGGHLFSANDEGFSLWDIERRCRIGFIAGFTPAYYHPWRRVFVQITKQELFFWKSKHQK